MEEEVPKCSATSWCPPMDARLNDEANARQKGLTTIVVYNFTTRQERCIGVAYKTKASDRGLMLNVCPWCGGSLEINR